MVKWFIIGGIAVVLIFILILIVAIKSAKPHEGSIWRDRKRTLFGLPWSFTVYELTEDRLFITTGFLSMSDEEIRLYRILDMTYKASIGQRMFGVGSITVNTSDKTAGEFEIKSVKRPREIKELLAKNVELQRDKKRVVNRELMVDDHIDAIEDADDFV